MKSRVPSARFVVRARAVNWRLTLDKVGGDGSAKANLRAFRADAAWGVVYEIDAADWEALDRCEPGYARVAIEVESDDGERISATTYVAVRVSEDAVAWEWYRQLIVEGAREHGLPEDYVAVLEALPARRDPRSADPSAVR
jgi:hypothetical protein